METTKCEQCKHLREEERRIDGWYCEKLKHPIENGYAMKFHSEHCDSYEKKEKKPIKQ